MNSDSTSPPSLIEGLLGQIAVITGGADGLGLALARRLVARGVKVAVLDRNPERLQAAVAELGSSCRGHALDITSRDAVRGAVAAVLGEFGSIHILVNCAGITGRTNLKSHEVDPDDFDQVMRVNVWGSLNSFQAVVPSMLKNGYGRVLHIASIAGKEGNAGMMSYSTSKAAVIGMTKAQGKEYAGTGVTVNALAPAVIRTEMVARLPEAQVAYMTSRIPMQRCGTLAEFAAMAEFIVSPQTSFTTGFTFDLSGGRAVY